jgi:copper(I)-binding protein
MTASLPTTRRAAVPGAARIRNRLAGLGALAGFAIGGAAPAAGGPVPAPPVVSDAWVRGTVEGQTGSGAYLRLTSPEDAHLVGASSPVADKVEIHEMRMIDERMTMRRIDDLPLPANRTVSLEHDYHVMLIGLHRQLKAGEQVALSLHWIDRRGARRKLDIQAPVRPLGWSGPDALKRHE